MRRIPKHPNVLVCVAILLVLGSPFTVAGFVWAFIKNAFDDGETLFWKMIHGFVEKVE